MKRWKIRSFGGPGSGNYGHAGRPGHRGGSLPKSGGLPGNAQTVRDLMTTDPLQSYEDKTLDQIAISIAESGKFAPRLDPYNVFVWRVTGKRKRKVEFSVDYHKHPLSPSMKFSTNKLTTPLIEEE